MKKSIYSRLQKSNCLFIPCCVFLLFSTFSAFAQSNTKDKYKFVIPKGQTLYSENTKAQKDLIPFKKEYLETSDLGTTKVVESGNFVIKEYVEEGIIKQDTLWFAISELRILNGDTLKSSHKLELKKTNNFPIDAKLSFKDDKIFIEQSDKEDHSIFAKIGKTKETVHPDDEGLYFKLSSDQEFEYFNKSIGLSIMTIPFRIRKNKSEESSDFSATAELNNIELYLGFRTSKYVFKKGKFRRNSFSLGPFFGPGVVKLNENNSWLAEGDEISVVGLNYGIAFLGSIERVNLGVAIGVERIENNKDLKWDFNNKLFIGFTLGYNLSEFP